MAAPVRPSSAWCHARARPGERERHVSAGTRRVLRINRRRRHAYALPEPAPEGAGCGNRRIGAAPHVFGLSYNSARRTNEIGIRKTLGVQHATLIVMIARETGWLVLAGLLIGGALSAAAGA